MEDSRLSEPFIIEETFTAAKAEIKNSLPEAANLAIEEEMLLAGEEGAGTQAVEEQSDVSDNESI